MLSPSEYDAETRQVGGQFHTTHWSVVLSAGQSDSVETRQALQTLCGAYWYPLYSFARRLGRGPQDAEDLTQGFFAYFLKSNLVAKAQPARGRFRSFLLATFKHFMAGEWDRARAQRRGGGRQFIAWESQSAEERYAREPRDEKDPEKLYEWSWAMALLERTVSRLEAEFAASRKQALFSELKDCMVGGTAESTYAVLAGRLGKTEAAIKETVRRMRLRYRQLFREEIAQTVESASEVEAELRHIAAVLRG
ncbi:MAG: sigma-70 family RNA polymerase sigma factor [Verrucomicrobiales bacterium]|nr:sigma-70 family RNA polymerase sigma factor [Verrucomicrobiales bacterium]